MSEELSYGQMKAMSNKMRQAKEERFAEQSRKRLDKIISTKIRTAFVGALASFEEEFGVLWGNEKEDDSELTDNERAWKEIWENVRTEILNNGNTQLRAARNEIANHVIQWKRYNMNFIMVGENK
jgi:hypothetical protein